MLRGLEAAESDAVLLAPSEDAVAKERTGALLQKRSCRGRNSKIVRSGNISTRTSARIVAITRLLRIRSIRDSTTVILYSRTKQAKSAPFSRSLSMIRIC